jgi:hypothetical protein
MMYFVASVDFVKSRNGYFLRRLLTAQTPSDLVESCQLVRGFPRSFIDLLGQCRDLTLRFLHHLDGDGARCYEFQCAFNLD